MLTAAEQYHALGISAEADGDAVIITMKDNDKGGTAAILILNYDEARKLMFNLAGAYLRAQRGGVDVYA